MNFLRAHKVEIFIFLIAVIARVFYFGISLNYQGDLTKTMWAADGYYEVSRNIIEGHGYSADSAPPYTPYSFRPPVYHYFIAGSYFLFGGYWGVIIFQMLIGSVLPLLAMRISRFVIDSRKIAIGVGVLLALEPYSILFSSILYTETFFTFLFFLSILFLFKYFKEKIFYYSLISAFLGLTTLVKPTAQYLPVLFALIFIWESRKNLSKKVFIYTGVYVLVFLLTISPWLYRNYREFNVIGISPQQGSALYTVLVPSVLTIENNTSFKQEFNELLNTGVAGPNQTNLVQSKEYAKRAIPILINHPAAFALLSANTALNFFIHDGMLDVLRHVGFTPNERLRKPALFILLSSPVEFFSLIKKFSTTPMVFVLLGRILWIFITVVFFAGVIRYFRHEKITPHVIIALSLVLYFMLTSLVIGLSISARYRMPVNLFIFSFATYEVLSIAALLRKKYSDKDVSVS